MIDIHCHIVPGVDDGATDRVMSLAMIEEAARLGITAIATTPHFMPGVDDDRTIALHQARLDSIEDRTGVRLMLSREVRVNSSLLAQTSFRELTYGSAGKYILLELATQESPGYLDQLLFALRLDGITPIIAHPERNMALLHDPKKIIDLVRAGAHMQLTTSSISGALGPTIQAFSVSMLRHRLVSFVASDAHNLSSRPFTDWEPALEAMRALELDESEIEGMTTHNTGAVLDSRELNSLELDSSRENAFLSSVSTKATFAPAKRKRFFFF